MRLITSDIATQGMNLRSVKHSRDNRISGRLPFGNLDLIWYLTVVVVWDLSLPGINVISLPPPLFILFEIKTKQNQQHLVVAVPFRNV